MTKVCILWTHRRTRQAQQLPVIPAPGRQRRRVPGQARCPNSCVSQHHVHPETLPQDIQWSGGGGKYVSSGLHVYKHVHIHMHINIHDKVRRGLPAEIWLHFCFMALSLQSQPKNSGFYLSSTTQLKLLLYVLFFYNNFAKRRSLTTRLNRPRSML